MASVEISRLLLLSLLSTTYGLPYFDEDWSPRQIREYFIQRAAEQARPRLDVGFNLDGQGVGQVSGVDVDSNGDLYVFHRADRPWTAETYVMFTNVLSEDAKVPISSDVIYKVDPKTGKLTHSFGKDFFNVPHGLKIDQHDNIWVTDVGRHQVFRFPKGATRPDLELGEKFVPGSDEKHFCKPTDVAVASNGDFFVSDGYCNNRILKFSSSGQIIALWGDREGSYTLTPSSLNIPHSITLIEELDLVCVADRENSRALCYNAGLNNKTSIGTFNRTLIPQGDMGKVYAIYYDKADKEMVAAGLLSEYPLRSGDGSDIYPARAFTYNLEGKQLISWAFITPDVARNGPSLIHDLCASRDGRDFYLADLDQKTVYKYTKNWSTAVTQQQ
ncbi:unnamed protein product [Lymnaea stagnalis]|uniref:peptidylamidoglycolate lyase n=1 Tax=Lymnaea stagnalis TaxID=6523 RepID=A0AAV2HMW8_LYMST